jgi:hypothetical protein
MRGRRSRITQALHPGYEISAVWSQFVAARAFNLPDGVVEFRAFFGRGISVLIENSYLSRFFAKFVEILAAGFATACSAYLVAQLVGPLPAARPTPAAVAVGSVEAPKSASAQSAPPVAAAVVDGERSASRPAGDAVPVQPAPKSAKAATSVSPAPKDVKTSTATPRGEKSAEALARAALASLDADRQAPADAPIRRAAPAAAVPVEAAPRATELPPPAAAEAPARATAEPPLPNAGASSVAAALEPETPREELKGLLSVPKRILGLLRPGAPSRADEAPRPPLPVGTTAGE